VPLPLAAAPLLSVLLKPAPGLLPLPLVGALVLVLVLVPVSPELLLERTAGCTTQQAASQGCCGRLRAAIMTLTHNVSAHSQHRASQDWIWVRLQDGSNLHGSHQLHESVVGSPPPPLPHWRTWWVSAAAGPGPHMALPPPSPDAPPAPCATTCKQHVSPSDS
jgi:hypothetical protein